MRHANRIMDEAETSRLEPFTGRAVALGGLLLLCPPLSWHLAGSTTFSLQSVHACTKLHQDGPRAHAFSCPKASLLLCRECNFASLLLCTSHPWNPNSMPSECTLRSLFQDNDVVKTQEFIHTQHTVVRQKWMIILFALEVATLHASAPCTQAASTSQPKLHNIALLTLTYT